MVRTKKFLDHHKYGVSGKQKDTDKLNEVIRTYKWITKIVYKNWGIRK